MRKMLFAVLAAGLAFAPAHAATYPGVDVWPRDIDKTPCDVWSKKPDGTWVQVKQVEAGGLTHWGFWFKNNQYSAMLDKKCG